MGQRDRLRRSLRNNKENGLPFVWGQSDLIALVICWFGSTHRLPLQLNISKKDPL